MFGTDLGREYELAGSIGVDPRSLFENGLAGALCDADTRERLRALGDAYDRWPEASAGARS
jgi:aminodeoxyfutalosine deaminase